MTLPRHLPMRLAVVFAITVVLLLVFLRYEERRAEADPWYQLSEALEQGQLTQQLRPRMLAALEHFDFKQPADDVALLLDAWQWLQEVGAQPDSQPVATTLWPWVESSLQQPRFNLSVINRIRNEPRLAIGNDAMQEITLRLERRLALLYAQVSQFDDRILEMNDASQLGPVNT
jgi:hypothetical protein